MSVDSISSAAFLNTRSPTLISPPMIALRAARGFQKIALDQSLIDSRLLFHWLQTSKIES